MRISPERRRTRSSRLASLFAYEDLKIRNLAKNRHLAKSISDAAWGRFLTWLRYYGSIYAIPVIAVEPAWTSQMCSGCGKIVKKSLSMRTHMCPFCGLVLDRDHNAAKNVLEKAVHGTGGQSGTSSSSLEGVGNAWGEASATAAFARMPEQDAS